MLFMSASQSTCTLPQAPARLVPVINFLQIQYCLLPKSVHHVCPIHSNHRVPNACPKCPRSGHDAIRLLPAISGANRPPRNPRPGSLSSLTSVNRRQLPQYLHGSQDPRSPKPVNLHILHFLRRLQQLLDRGIVFQSQKWDVQTSAADCESRTHAAKRYGCLLYPTVRWED